MMIFVPVDRKVSAYKHVFLWGVNSCFYFQLGFTMHSRRDLALSINAVPCVSVSFNLSCSSGLLVSLIVRCLSGFCSIIAPEVCASVSPALFAHIVNVLLSPSGRITWHKYFLSYVKRARAMAPMEAADDLSVGVWGIWLPFTLTNTVVFPDRHIETWKN